ncbi:MAG: methyltransferase domain-containing protein [Chloroflexi bacterium]|nr:methyltransferase domain-containing protein [Chloroflexota bacterium]MCI0725289.1 methyltransferase domain-containing protein [Chloroflexota bacterium]
MTEERYTQGNYLEDNPSWHVEDSPWKAQQILKIIQKNHLTPKTVCEVGCGAGEILFQLQKSMEKESLFWGYEVSPQAYALCQERANERLHFKLADILEEKDAFFDIVLAIDLIEHLENYFQFLREIKSKGEFKIFHIPLNLSVQAVLRAKPLVISWRRLGHIHNFTKETALQALEDLGYEIIDSLYTSSYTELPPKSKNAAIARIPRKIAFSIHKDLTARILGGYSLLILSR